MNVHKLLDDYFFDGRKLTKFDFLLLYVALRGIHLKGDIIGDVRSYDPYETNLKGYCCHQLRTYIMDELKKIADYLEEINDGDASEA